MIIFCPQLKKIKLAGEIDGSEWASVVTEENVHQIHDESFSLHRLAARAKILSCLDDDTGKNNAIPELKGVIPEKLAVFTSNFSIS